MAMMQRSLSQDPRICFCCKSSQESWVWLLKHVAQSQVLSSWTLRDAGSCAQLRDLGEHKSRSSLHSEVRYQVSHNPCQTRILIKMEFSKKHGLQSSGGIGMKFKKRWFWRPGGDRTPGLGTMYMTMHLALAQRVPPPMWWPVAATTFLYKLWGSTVYWVSTWSVLHSVSLYWC